MKDSIVPLWWGHSAQPLTWLYKLCWPNVIVIICNVSYAYVIIFFLFSFFFLLFSTPSSRSEPSPKNTRQSLSIKQAFRGGKTDGRIQSPHSPKTGEERRALKGKDTSTIYCSQGDISIFIKLISVHLLCQMTPVHHGTELLGKSALRGLWGSLLKKRLQLGSHLECDSMTVLLHRLIAWVSVSWLTQ